jgi:hypothetical protein
LAARSRVAKTLGDLADQGLIDVVTDRVQKTHPKTGDRYWDTEILVRPAASPDLDYGKIADFGEYKERKAYTYQEPCPECGEVHSRTRRTFCNGCGAETDAPRIMPVQARQDVAAEPDDPPESAMTKNVMAKDGPAPSVSGPINYYSTKNVMAQELDTDVVHTEHARANDSPSTCMGGCGAFLPPDRVMLCEACEAWSHERADRQREGMAS